MPAAPIRREITRHIRWLERRLGAADRDLDDTIQKSPVGRANENLLRTVPGIGPVEPHAPLLPTDKRASALTMSPVEDV
jgi:hypothetical protein